MFSFKAAAVALSIIGVCDGSARQNLHFVETFDEGDVFASGKWVLSSKEKYKDQPVMIKPAINSPPELANDKGIELTQEMKFYGFGSAFEEPIDTTGKDIVVQYEVKLDSFQCGGAYVKLPRASDVFNIADLDNDTPYTIMFGPDRCGSSNKVHFILQHQSPITKEWDEKHFSDPTLARLDKNTHLYTLAVHSDNSFEVYVDMQLEKSGNLLSSMEPPVNPPKTIDDPTDFKPSDWVDEATIPDPAAVKPADWDEDAPMMIVDPDDRKPGGWLDDEPKQIPDPEAEKPDDWDDEEDGLWDAPTVPNPKCETVGCGEWAPKKMRNPAYKGKWTPPRIDNPDYRGEWAPRQIPNPNYFVDERPADMAPIGGLAVEVWTTNGGIHFDNFVLASSLSDAFAFAEETFRLKETAEKAQDVRELDQSRRAAREEKLAEGGFVNVFQVYMADFLDLIATQSPIALVSAIVMLAVSVYFCIPSTPNSHVAETAPASPSAAGEDEDAADKAQKEGDAGDVAEISEDEDDSAQTGKKSPSKRRTRKTD